MQQFASATQSRPHFTAAAVVSRWDRLTQAAFVLSLSLVACRLLMSETLRDPFDPLAGGAAAPAAPGPAISLLLDLLFCLPALLLIGRRAFDDEFRLIFSWSHLPMGMLAVWAVLSPLWAGDKFIALISASNVLAALVFLWSTSQLIHCWKRFRLVAGLCVGLLVALSLAGYYYRLVELNDLRQVWGAHKTEILSAHGWKPGSYEATLFQNRVLKGQPMGFSASTNTYAALLVLLGVVTAGVAIQHLSDRDHAGWAAAPAVAVAATAALIYWTGCRAAYATPLLAAMILAGTWLLRPWLRKYPRAAFAMGVAGVLLIGGLVIEHGLRTGKLWHDSLNFRWRYWVGSFRTLTAGYFEYPRHYFHLLCGVGWENFGPYYLAHRLPIASEEIRDPHNFIVRVFVELGLVGGILLLAWMLRLWWELSRPAAQAGLPPAPADALPHRRRLTEQPARTRALGVILLIALTGIALNSAASVDLTADGWYVFLEFIRRGLFFCALLLGLAFAALRMRRPIGPRDEAETEFDLDDRPAPWVRLAILAALATFLIHNLIEFSFFEPGPMCLFALLCGSALGVQRHQNTTAAATALPHSHLARGRLAATVALALFGAGWLAAAVVLATPVAAAESLARQADSDAGAAVAVRAAENPARSQDLFARAATTMSDAYHRLPYNADYAARAFRLMLAAGLAQREPRVAQRLLDDAVKADPSSASHLYMRARFKVRDPSQFDSARRDYERALLLDPNNVRMRLDFALALKELSVRLQRPRLAADALLEYTRAMDLNNLLSPDEIKRLTPEERAAANRALDIPLAAPATSPSAHNSQNLQTSP